MVNSTLARGDIVSFSAPLIQRIQILSDPIALGEVYSFDLHYQGQTKTISTEQDPGATLNDIATALADSVRHEVSQPVQSQVDGFELILSGCWVPVSTSLGLLAPTGGLWSVSNLTPNLELAPIPDVRGVSGRGAGRVIRVQPYAYRLREETIETQKVWVRFLDSDELIEVAALDIPWLVASASSVL